MQYQVLEQSAPGEPWHFVAHGARYRDKTEAEAAAAAIAKRGGRSRLIPCGTPRKRNAPAVLIAGTAHGARCHYWRTPAGLYVAESPDVGADAIGRRVGGYRRLDGLMRLRGERPDVIAAHCTPDGRDKESGQ